MLFLTSGRLQTLYPPLSSLLLCLPNFLIVSFDVASLTAQEKIMCPFSGLPEHPIALFVLFLFPTKLLEGRNNAYFVPCCITSV